MLCGAHPFDLDGSSDEEAVLRRVRAGIVPLGGLGPGISDSAKDLIARCEREKIRAVTPFPVAKGYPPPPGASCCRDLTFFCLKFEGDRYVVRRF